MILPSSPHTPLPNQAGSQTPIKINDDPSQSDSEQLTGLHKVVVVRSEVRLQRAAFEALFEKWQDARQVALLARLSGEFVVSEHGPCEVLQSREIVDSRRKRVCWSASLATVDGVRLGPTFHPCMRLVGDKAGGAAAVSRNMAWVGFGHSRLPFPKQS